LIAGVGVSLVAGPLGCFIVWRRLAYFGDTLSHAALLGVALAVLFQINITLSVFLLSVFVSLALIMLQRRVTLSADALLGLLAHSALAFGMVALSFMTWVRVDLMGFLFGDILAVTPFDIALIWGGGSCVLVVLIFFWQSLFASTINHELAQAEGMKPEQANIIFMLLMSAVIVIAMKIVGVLLITSMLIFPAAIARRFANGPEQMAFFAVIIGIIAVFGGLFGSLQWDTPAGPSIVVAASAFFIVTILPATSLQMLKNSQLDKPKAK
jgi:zinc transport system permease protein